MAVAAMPSSGVRKLRLPTAEISTEPVTDSLLANVNFSTRYLKFVVLLDRLKEWLGKT